MMINTTAPCRWCGHYHGGICPAVRAIEYHADGITVKRVEFHDLTPRPIEWRPENPPYKIT